ncbi:hypothetical protein EZ428_04020 [Pedobacter frigiditerrae]|uniref:Lipocalin-like domain-containing protein n=1 Tax=Pedobacter frigiditerrae TaxID=2530452 RepID=A0A4R0N290_9SPHI|nr:hypothetical protein [Pedobacter frigiditerrae]TCC93948.1 hypothetical protein EZ428_04020 [Pedobacter frigiditerrae]
MKQIFSQVLFLLFLAVPAMSQEAIENDLVGSWKVNDVQLLSIGTSNELITAAKVLSKSFLKAQFEFKVDKHFSFDCDDADMRIKNGHWKYNPKTKSIIIQEWRDRNMGKPILMEMFIKRDGNKFTFLLSETPLVLLVEKSNKFQNK